MWGLIKIKSERLLFSISIIVLLFIMNWSTGAGNFDLTIDKKPKEPQDKKDVKMETRLPTKDLDEPANNEVTPNDSNDPIQRILYMIKCLSDEKEENASINQSEETRKAILDKDVDCTTGDLILVNKWTSLDPSYVPKNLIEISDEDSLEIIQCSRPQLQIEESIYKALINLFNAAKEAGHDDLIVISGYRSYDLQDTLYENEVKEFEQKYGKKNAREKAAEVVAPPGTSEHQTGFAIDVTTFELLQEVDPLTEEFGQTAQGKWLHENSWKYGFIIRYLPDKKDITGIIYEPWHLRYVGMPHSEIMYENNWCLEEYLEYIKEKEHVQFKTYEENGNVKTRYEIFYSQVPLSEEVFIKEFGDEIKYNISGNGCDGYIITIAIKIY